MIDENTFLLILLLLSPFVILGAIIMYVMITDKYKDWKYKHDKKKSKFKKGEICIYTHPKTSDETVVEIGYVDFDKKEKKYYYEVMPTNFGQQYYYGYFTDVWIDEKDLHKLYGYHQFDDYIGD